MTALALRDSSRFAAILVPLFSLLGTDSPSLATETSGLFDSHEPLSIEVHLDRGELCASRDRPDCKEVPATLAYRTGEGDERRVESFVSVRGRGKGRTADCDLPALFVRFPPEEVAGTLFDGERLLPITTHCRNDRPDYDQYLLKEYLAYRLYNVISEKSIRVRLVRLRYRGPGGEGKGLERYAFFSEHFDSVAARNEMEVWSPEVVDLRLVDDREMTILALFQFMIGNLDWSVPRRHNIMAMRNARADVSAVPFDFDYAGMVDAEYAVPPPSLPVRSVQDRLYRGVCPQSAIWDETLATFEGRREVLLGLVESVPGLQSVQRNRVTSYLREFFRVLGDRESRRKAIVEACR